jgi:DNA mismatch endonuclease (patch repair protein)
MTARDPETTYRIMSAIKSKNTKPERLLAREMWKRGLRYRKQYKIKGRPDFVFVKARIAIFCDGDFWHGHNWAIRGMESFEEELSSYSKTWREKLTRNVQRDKSINRQLEAEGWIVLRFWESEIKKSPEACAIKIKTIYDACS